MPDRPRRCALPGDDQPGERGGHPPGHPHRMGEHGARNERGTDQCPEHRTGRGPCRAGALHFAGDELAEDGGSEREREHHRAEPLYERSQHGPARVDRCQQYVADVGHLDRDRTAVGPAAHTQRTCNRNGDTDDRRAPAEEVVGGDVGADEAVDCIRRPDDDGETRQRKEVDAVGHVEPFGVAEAAALSGAAEITQRGEVLP